MYYPKSITDDWDGVVIAACALLAPLFFISEGFCLMNFGYSKFAGFKDRSMLIPGKIGMFAIYFPAALVFPLAAIVLGFGTSSWPCTPRVASIVCFCNTLFSHRHHFSSRYCCNDHHTLLQALSRGPASAQILWPNQRAQLHHHRGVLFPNCFHVLLRRRLPTFFSCKHRIC